MDADRAFLYFNRLLRGEGEYLGPVNRNERVLKALSICLSEDRRRFPNLMKSLEDSIRVDNPDFTDDLVKKKALVIMAIWAFSLEDRGSRGRRRPLRSLVFFNGFDIDSLIRDYYCDESRYGPITEALADYVGLRGEKLMERLEEALKESIKYKS